MKTRPTKTLKTIANRTVAVLMCTCMIGSSVPTTAFAAQSSNGLCEHHTAHDLSCGYSEATQGHECNHTHTEECGENCTHTHNEECGYSEGMAGSPCTYVCEECNGGNDNDNDSGNNNNAEDNNSPANEPKVSAGENDNTTDDQENNTEPKVSEGDAEDNEDDEEDVCTCTEACTEESVNGECPVCKVGGAFDLCKGAKQDADDTENKDESTKSEDEADSRYTITAWEWVDEEGNLDPETGALVLSADEEEPCAFGDVEELLPKQITAQVKENEDANSPDLSLPGPNEEENSEAEDTENTEDTPVTVEETIDLCNWECESYPEEGAFRGAYVFKAALPEGYALSEDTGELEVEVKFDTPQVLDAADGYDSEGFCEGYTFDSDGNWVKNENAEEADKCTHENCNGYQPAVQITNDNAATYGFTTDTDKEKYKDYYAITNAGQLYWFATHVNAKTKDGNDTRTSKAVLINNITVNSSLVSEKLDTDGTPNTGADIRNWIPIGYNNADYNYSTFQGTFDGQGKTISGIYCSLPEESNGVGLFGRLDNGTISNVTLADSYLSGKENVGGICGQIGAPVDSENITGGKIENCTNQATVTGTGNYIGGIYGSNVIDSDHSCTISNCTNSGTISGAGWVGGICGSFQKGTMQDCTNSGDVTGTDSVGGICGYFDKSSTVGNCENSGSISGAACVGGICGQNSSNTITGCKNSGSVTGTGTTTTMSEENGFIGGICGNNQGTITNCNNLAAGAVNASRGASYVGGVWQKYEQARELYQCCDRYGLVWCWWYLWRY